VTDSLPTETEPVTRQAPTLAAARKAKEMTQQELATAAGMSIGSIREYEQLVRTVMYSRTWHKLCDLLDVDPETGFHGLTRTFNR
jgi:transcriptional regulator with XRE-family HTH domain